MKTWFNNCMNWANREKICTSDWHIYCNNTSGQRCRDLSIFLFGFMLSGTELSRWKQSSRKQVLSQDTWGGEEGGRVNSRARGKADSWRGKEKLAAIGSLWVWLTAVNRLMARTRPGGTHSVVAWKSLTWDTTNQDEFDMQSIRCLLKIAVVWQSLIFTGTFSFT